MTAAQLDSILVPVEQVNTIVGTTGPLSGNPPNIALQCTLGNNPVVCQHVLYFLWFASRIR
ncbi:sensor domain-containing protein [Mycobacterium tilburgii]|uniref:sensor domain-containing protein n=1 Tax=Mycobacterium tilburgii TaxID=44467 RepID=UPI001181D295|nr:sensor domain-containing protein [Mycobacterium tilburgii]